MCEPRPMQCYLLFELLFIVLLFDSQESFWSRWNCPARCSGGRRPLIAGCLSLQRLGVDISVIHPVWDSIPRHPASESRFLAIWAIGATRNRLHDDNGPLSEENPKSVNDRLPSSLILGQLTVRPLFKLTSCKLRSFGFNFLVSCLHVVHTIIHIQLLPSGLRSSLRPRPEAEALWNSFGLDGNPAFEG